MDNTQDGFKVSGVRHDDAHSLRVDRALPPDRPEGRSPRMFWWTCGGYFGELFDSSARDAYRAHREGAGWRSGLSRDEQEDVAMHIVGWFSGHDPAEYKKALRAGLRHVERARARDTTTR